MYKYIKFGEYEVLFYGCVISNTQTRVVLRENIRAEIAGLTGV
jgi:hypothetical protein